MAASVRVAAPSLPRALSVWKSTVRLVSPRTCAISRSASLVAPFDYTAMIWALVLGYAMFGETPTVEIIGGSAIIAAAGLFVIWRERQLATTRRRDGLEPAPTGAATTLRTP
jgi:hypothetical protein